MPIQNGFDTEKGEGYEERKDATSTALSVVIMQLYMINYTKCLLHASVITNAVSWKIEGSNDYSNFVELLASTSIAAAGQAYAVVTDAWACIRVSIIDTVAASHGVLTLVAVMKP